MRPEGTASQALERKRKKGATLTRAKEEQGIRLNGAKERENPFWRSSCSTAGKEQQRARAGAGTTAGPDPRCSAELPQVTPLPDSTGRSGQAPAPPSQGQMQEGWVGRRTRPHKPQRFAHRSGH